MTKQVLCVGHVATVPVDDAVVRRIVVTAVGEESQVPVTVSLLRSKSSRTDGRWSAPAFDLGPNGGFYSTPGELVRRAKVLMPDEFDTPLSDDELLQAAIEHDARAGLPGYTRVLPTTEDHDV